MFDGSNKYLVHANSAHTHTHTYANCAVRCTKTENWHVVTDQDGYIKQFRPIIHPGLTSAPAEAKATTVISD
eukprot:413046-Pyramimonas_sp.AAC.1